MQLNADDEKMRLLQAGLERVRQEFISTLPGRMQELDGLLDDLYADGASVTEVVGQIGRQAHKLHGQAGSFGFENIGKVAATLEMSTISFSDNSDSAHTEKIEAKLILLLDEIGTSLAGGT